MHLVGAEVHLWEWWRYSWFPLADGGSEYTEMLDGLFQSFSAVSRTTGYLHFLFCQLGVTLTTLLAYIGL